MIGAGAIGRLPHLGLEHVFLITDEGTVLHSSKERGRVTEEPIGDWLTRPGVRIERYLDWATLQRAKIFGRSKIGQRWSVFENCEHFVSEITTGAKISRQLQVGVVLSSFIIALALLKITK